MKQSFLLLVVLSVLLAFGLASCQSRKPMRQGRGMYYWSTVFRLDEPKVAFLEAHRVDRLYVRYFDVTLNDAGEAVPNATIRFDSVVNCKQEIVPVVFIHNDCMRKPEKELADKLLKRIMQMSETHQVGVVKEIQIDCDWTMKTREAFFTFLKELHERTQEQGIVLSTTIRLHQLSQPVPPVDRGVLMVYNTGDLTKMEVEKPILDINDVRPYLSYLRKYDLPMATALPIYKWDLVFRNGKFVDIMYHDDDLPLLASDTIVKREPTLGDILECKNAIGQIKEECLDEVILYDLNNYNITRYNKDDYEKIFD